jgi:hypothetical protein
LIEVFIFKLSLPGSLTNINTCYIVTIPIEKEYNLITNKNENYYKYHLDLKVEENLSNLKPPKNISKKQHYLILNLNNLKKRYSNIITIYFLGFTCFKVDYCIITVRKDNTNII